MKVKGDSLQCCSCDNEVPIWHVRLYGCRWCWHGRFFARAGDFARAWTQARAISRVFGHGLALKFLNWFFKT